MLELNLQYFVYLLEILFLLSSISYFIWNLNLTEVPPLKEVIKNVQKARRAEVVTPVGLPDPDEEEKRKKR